PILAAQKSVALGQDLQHPFAGQHDLLIEQLLLDAKDEILLTQSGHVLDREMRGHVLEHGDGWAPQFGDVQGTLRTGGRERGGRKGGERPSRAVALDSRAVDRWTVGAQSSL